jgi:hypothetical protein
LFLIFHIKLYIFNNNLNSKIMKITNEIGKAVKSLNDQISAHKNDKLDQLEEVAISQYIQSANEVADLEKTLVSKMNLREKDQMNELYQLKTNGIAQMQSEIVDAEGTGLVAIANAFVANDANLDAALNTSFSEKQDRWLARWTHEGNYTDDFLPGWDSYAG